MNDSFDGGFIIGGVSTSINSQNINNSLKQNKTFQLSQPSK